MRGLAACLVGVLGLGALATMGACSDSTDMGTGGAGGGSAAGSAGKTSSAGSSNTAGSSSEAGAGGAGECPLRAVACNDCLNDKCGDLAAACGAIESCNKALQDLPDCACDPANDATECAEKFATDEGDPAFKLLQCLKVNCADSCHPG